MNWLDIIRDLPNLQKIRFDEWNVTIIRDAWKKAVKNGEKFTKEDAEKVIFAESWMQSKRFRSIHCLTTKKEVIKNLDAEREFINDQLQKNIPADILNLM